MSGTVLSRRQLLRLGGATLGGALLAACQPKVVEKVVKETVIVEVEKEPEVVEKVVKETVIVEKEAPKEPITLNFLNRGGEYIANVMDRQMKLYQETNPDIQFEINAVVGAEHQEALLMMLSAGTGPDCWFDANRTTGMLAQKGIALDLEPYLEADPKFNEDDYVPNVWAAQTYFGDRWGLPWDSGGMAVAFDLDRFDEVGLPYPEPDVWMTWDDLIALATQLTFDMNDKTPADAGFDPARVRQYGFIPDTGHGKFTYVWANDAEIIEADGSAPVDSDNFIEAMNWLADLGVKHYVSPSAAYEQATTMDMRSHNVAIQHMGVWMLGRFNEAGVKYGLMQVPYNTTKASYGHYSPLCVYKESEHTQEAYDFIFFASCSYDGEKILVDEGMQQPIRKDLRETFLKSETPPAPEYRQVFYDAFEGPTFRWPGDKFGSYYCGWCQYFNDLWAPYLDALWAGEKRWEEMATEVREKTEHLFQTGEVT